MSDQERRSRERIQDPTLEAEIERLRERLKLEEDFQHKLELAAYCGHEAARALVSEPHDPEAWRHDAWMGVLKLAAAPDEPWCGFVTCEPSTRKPTGYAACRRPVGHEGHHYMTVGEKGGAHVPASLRRWLAGLLRWKGAMVIAIAIAERTLGARERECEDAASAEDVLIWPATSAHDRKRYLGMLQKRLIEWALNEEGPILG